MSQSRFDDVARAALTTCVRDVEKTTDAELVLIVRARSGSYRHADYIFGALLGFCGLLFLLFSPVTFNSYWVAIDVALLFALGALLSSRTNGIRRMLTSRKHRARAVRTEAAAMFYEAGIANTKAEMGVLVYLSLFERQLELIADRGVLSAVPALEWNQMLHDLHEAGATATPDALQTGLCKLGDLLTRYLPASVENPNEIDDMPRFEI